MVVLAAIKSCFRTVLGMPLFTNVVLNTRIRVVIAAGSTIRAFDNYITETLDWANANCEI